MADKQTGTTNFSKIFEKTKNNLLTDLIKRKYMQ